MELRGRLLGGRGAPVAGHRVAPERGRVAPQAQGGGVPQRGPGQEDGGVPGQNVPLGGAAPVHRELVAGICSEWGWGGQAKCFN